MQSELKASLVLFLSPLLAMPYASAEDAVQVKSVDGQDISVDDLAHSFFYHFTGSSDVLRQLVGADDAQRIALEIAAHQRQMDDVRAHATKLRRLCSELQGSRNSSDFAAALANNEQRERSEQRQAANRILRGLDDADRETLQDYLETQFRQGFARTTIDYGATFSSAEFPTGRTNAITSRICMSAAQAEGILRQ